MCLVILNNQKDKICVNPLNLRHLRAFETTSSYDFLFSKNKE